MRTCLHCQCAHHSAHGASCRLKVSSEPAGRPKRGRKGRSGDIRTWEHSTIKLIRVNRKQAMQLPIWAATVDLVAHLV